MERSLTLKAMIESFIAMRNDKQYIAETNDLDQGFSVEIIKSTDDW